MAGGENGGLRELQRGILVGHTDYNLRGHVSGTLCQRSARWLEYRNRASRHHATQALLSALCKEDPFFAALSRFFTGLLLVFTCFCGILTRYQAYFPENDEQTPEYHSSHHGISQRFGPNLDEFQRAVKQHHTSKHLSSSGEDMLNGLHLPDLQSFVSR
jgi:hypothetical protein